MISLLFSIESRPVHIPTNSVWETVVFHNLVNTGCLFSFNTSHSHGYEMVFIVILNCISLMTSDNDDFFMCLVAIFFGEVSIFFCSSAHFLMGLFVWVLHVSWVLANCWDISYKNIFSHSAGHLFLVMIVSFAVWMFFNLISSH